MAEGAQRQFVWDIPTRIFHWLLVVLLGFSWWSAETYHLDWHRYSGITVLGLVAFRLLWGLFGTSTARFAQFVKGPGAVVSYVRPSSQVPVPIGHNPLGGWSVIVMLLLLLVQVTSGLFAVDIDGIESGPLSHLVDFDQGRTASAIHEFSFNLLLIVVALHIIAIMFYLVVRRRNLVGPMITGFQRVSEGGAGVSAVRVPNWRLVVTILAAALLAYGVWNGFRF
jgi:cytochrome b